MLGNMLPIEGCRGHLLGPSTYEPLSRIMRSFSKANQVLLGDVGHLPGTYRPSLFVPWRNIPRPLLCPQRFLSRRHCRHKHCERPGTYGDHLHLLVLISIPWIRYKKGSCQRRVAVLSRSSHSIERDVALRISRATWHAPCQP
jgi:hypothetical protein